MKTAIALTVALLLGAPLFAQETLLDHDIDFSGYGGPGLQFTSVAGAFGVMVGGSGGLIVDHTLILGGAGYGLANNIKVADAPATAPYLNFGYGGGYVRYINNSDALIHVTGGVLIGAGGVGYRGDFDNDAYEIWDDRDTLNDAFFIVEPDIEAEMNVTKGFRIGIGAGYRFVSGIELPGLTNSDIAGPSARLMFKFGSF